MVSDRDLGVLSLPEHHSCTPRFDSLNLGSQFPPVERPRVKVTVLFRQRMYSRNSQLMDVDRVTLGSDVNGSLFMENLGT